MTAGTLERVRKLLAKQLGVPPESIGEDASLEQLGLDSLGALELVFQIEEEFSVKVPDESLKQLRTVRAICDGVEALQGG